MTVKNSEISLAVPVIGFVACSGTGKTTLLSQLIPLLRDSGLRIAVVKHTHHDFDIDKPGKDSYILRQAGATQTLLASGKRTALIIEHEAPREEVQLQDCLTHLALDSLDLVLVEGFKHETYPKIELQRGSLEHPARYPQDSHIIAVASDNPTPAQYQQLEGQPPTLDINNPRQICDFILQFINHQT